MSGEHMTYVFKRLEARVTELTENFIRIEGKLDALLSRRAGGNESIEDLGVLFSKLPINSLEEFEDFEKGLEDDDTRKKFVNSLDVQEDVFCSPYMKLSYVTLCDFLIHNLIRMIYESENRKIPLFKDEQLFDGFVQDYFPEFYKEQKFNIKEEEQVLILLSLVMYVSCVQCQIKDVQTKCCTFLDSNAQEKLTVFFQQMELIGKGKFTKNNIIKAIQTSLEQKDKTEDKDIESCRPLKKEYEKINTKLIEDLVIVLEELSSENDQLITKLSKYESESPTLQMKKEINLLKNLLKETNNEYNDLAEINQVVEVQLKRSQTEVKTLQQKVKGLMKELNNKYIDSYTPMNMVKKEYDDKINKKLREDLNIELEELMSKNYQLFTKLSKSESEVTQLKWDIKVMELNLNSLMEVHRHSQVLLNLLKAENIELKKEVEDLKNINEELRNQTERFYLQNLSCPRIEENLGEVLLADKQKEIDALSQKMSSLKQSFEIFEKEKIHDAEELQYDLQSKKDQLLEKCNEISQYKEEHDKLFDNFNRLSDEHHALKLKCNSIKKSNKNIRRENDPKLKKIEDQMCTDCETAVPLAVPCESAHTSTSTSTNIECGYSVEALAPCVAHFNVTHAKVSSHPQQAICDKYKSQKWAIQMKGADGTLYEGEQFTLQFKFSSKYLFDLPEVTRYENNKKLNLYRTFS